MSFTVLCAEIVRVLWSGIHLLYLLGSYPISSCVNYIYPCLAVPPRFVNKVRNAYLVEGEDAQFTCTIEGAPRPQIRSVLHVTLGQILFSHSAWPDESPCLFTFQFMTLSSLCFPPYCHSSAGSS